ncbi:MAG: hydrogenase maturation nickel metallochaperone HypA [Labilithrix sp.]|nr:hydrogenase maturation nickel metallochaperone HypA [Labilithrix sp.]
MHELGITRSIVAIAAENAGGLRVKRVIVAIGELSGIDADAVRFCFDICAKGTVVESAKLEIERVPGRGRCAACELEATLTTPYGACAACNAPLRVIGGEELKVKAMEVDDVRDMRV